MEIIKMNYKVTLRQSLSLQRLSCIAVGTALWQSHNVEKKIKELGLECGDFKKIEILCQDHWHNRLTKKVIENANSLPLFKTIMEDLEKSVITLGRIWYWWIVYAYDNLQLRSKFTAKVFWTSFGLIDEAKIACDFWLKELPNHFFKLRNHNPNQAPPMSFWACSYAQRDVIYKHEVELKNFVKNLYEVDVDDSEDKIYSLVTLILISRHKCESVCNNHYNFNVALMIDEFLEAENYAMTVRPDVMLELCAFNQYVDGVKYYWNKINENELISANSVCTLTVRLLDSKYIHIHEGIKLIEILSFLLNQMPIEERKNFIISNINMILPMNALVWPYFQEISFFDLEFIDWSNINYEKILNCLCTIYNARYTQLLKAKGIYVEFFEKILEVMPKHCKVDLFTQNEKARAFCELFGVSWLKLLLSDGDLKNFRKEIIMTGSKLYERLFQCRRFDLVINLLHIMSDNERKHFIKSFDFEQAMVKSRIFDYFDTKECGKFLEWLFSSKSHKLMLDVNSKSLGKVITDHSAELCLELTKRQNYQLADKFLNWQFELEEEKANFKVSVMANYEAVVKIIYHLWVDTMNIEDRKINVELSALNCSKFLMYYLSSEEEITKYKKEKLNIFGSEMFSGTLMNDLHDFSLDDVETFNNLLDYLLVPEERIAQVKNDIRTNIGLKIYQSERKCYSLRIFEFLVDWVYNEEEKENVIQNCLQSEEGVSFCKNLAENENEIRWVLLMVKKSYLRKAVQEKIDSFKKK